MRKTHGRLLRELDAIEGDVTLGQLSEQLGVSLDRVQDGLETLKILRLYGIDVRDATAQTTIFVGDDER